MPQSDRRRGGFGVLLLFYQIFGGIGIDRIPPATLIITALQILLYTRVIKVPWHGLDDVCISADKVWGKKQYRRLFIGAFEHADDWHLYYNMISFIWKGITLERFFGSGRFFFIVSVFTCLCNLTLVALSMFASEFYEPYFYYQCAVGFSGVIFALKVLTTHYWPSNQGLVMGIPVDIPAKYIVWAELILIQLFVPNISFVGHLAGVLVGVAYIHSPLKAVMSRIWATMANVLFATPEPYRATTANNGSWPGYNNYRPNNNWTRHFSPYGNEYQWGNDGDLPYPPDPYRDRQPSSEEQRQAFSTAASEEDAMLQRAIEESLKERNYENVSDINFQEWDQPSNEPSAPYPEPTSSNLPYPTHPSPSVPPSQPSSHLPYPDEPSYEIPSTSNRLYPDLDEVRRRRLNRFQT